MTETVTEIRKKHKGYWLAILVTRRNRLGVPVRGRLLARARSHHGLHARLEDEPDHDVYETYGGKVPRQAVLF